MREVWEGKVIRTIDADALNAAIEKWFDGVCVYDASPSEATNDFQSIVDEQPTISPDEVRGAGKWIDKGVRAWSCSCCGTPINHIRQFASFEKNELPNYCPNCGARLTGGEND